MSAAEYPWERALGAVPGDDGTVEFRVWAPHPERVDVRVGGADHALSPEGYGIRSARVPAKGGERLGVRAPRPRPPRPGEPLATRGPARPVPGRRPRRLRLDRRRPPH